MAEPLLERGRRGVALTPAGQALLHHARLVMQQVQRMRGELGEYARGLKGHVRVYWSTPPRWPSSCPRPWPPSWPLIPTSTSTWTSGRAVVPEAAARRWGHGGALGVAALEEPWAKRQLMLVVRQIEAVPLHARQLVEHLAAGAGT